MINLIKSFIILVLSLFLFTSCSTNNLELDSSKNGERYTKEIDSPDSIAELGTLNINGLDQYLLIRGNHVENPVLLFLHGGPFNTYMPSHHSLMGLEERFITVEWDQRGSGFLHDIGDLDPGTLTVEQYVSDIQELTKYLIKRFNKEKIYLIGFSWGSFIGLKAIDENPELYHAYIGMSQLVNAAESEQVSYSYILETAKKKKNHDAIVALEALGYDPSKLEERGVLGYWKSYFGYSLHNTSSEEIWKKAKQNCTEYLKSDYLKKRENSRFSGDFTLMESMSSTDFVKELPRVDIPVYFFAGRYDLVTPFQIVEEYYETLEAPYKEIIWFEKSAHIPSLEETEEFTKAVIDILPKS